MICRLLFLSVLIACPPQAFSQAIETAAVTAVGSGELHSLVEDLQDLSNKIQAEATLTSFNVRSDLIVLAENLTRLAAELEKGVVKDLNQSEQKMIADVRLVVDEFQGGNTAAIGRLESVVSSLGGELARVPGFDNAPLVSGVRPAFAVVRVADPNDTVEVVVTGSLLGRGEQSLMFHQAPCEVLIATESSVRFRCRVKDMWPQGKLNSWATGSLSITRNAEWWEFWKSSTTSAYPAAVRKIDRVLGYVTAEVKVTETSNTRTPRRAEREVRSSPCRSDTANWTFDPVAGCTIDVTTIEIDRGAVSSRSRFNGIQRQNEHGFVVQGVSRGSGDRVGGVCVGGGRGVVAMTARWVDVCPVAGQRSIKLLERQPIMWGSDLPISLPNPNDGFLVEVAENGGGVRAFTSSGASAWLTIEHDAVGYRVVVRPKTLEEAFR